MSSAPRKCSGATSQDPNTESWVVVDTNGYEILETEHSGLNNLGDSMGVTESHRYMYVQQRSRRDGNQSLRASAMRPLRNFGKWIAKGLEASKKYNLPQVPYSQQPPSAPKKHQSQQREPYQQPTQQHQTHSHQQPPQKHQTQQTHSHQQPAQKPHQILGCSTLVSPSQPPPIHAATQQHQEPVQTSAVNLPSELIGKIIYHHPLVRQNLEDAIQAEFASLTRISSDYKTIYVSGTRGCNVKAAFQVEQMVGRIKSHLADELLQLHPMFFAVLVDPEVVEVLKDIQEGNLVEIELLRSSEYPVGESFSTLAQQWDSSHHTNCIRVSELKDYTSLCAPISTVLPHGYEWWVWDDSRGGYVAFSHEVSQHLNDCYCNQKLDRTEFTYNGKHYVADFQANTFTEVSSGNVQWLKKQPQPIWSYSIDHTKFVPHQPSDSKAIEHMYRYGGYHMKLAGSDHTFDFDPKSMSQIDLLTGEKVCLQRCPMPEISTPPQHSIRVRIRGLPENVSSARNELELVLQAATETVEDDQLLQMFRPEHHKTVLAYFSNAVRQYCILFTSSQQDENGPTCIQIQGDPQHVAGMYDDLISRCLVMQKCIAARTQQFHPFSLPLATPPNQTGPDFELKNVPPHSPEWNMVLEVMQQTMPAVRIQSLQQVNHRYQWDRYQLEMTHMKRNGDSINEWYLFHGTRQSDPMDVVQSDRGFDFRCSREDCLWGSGVYFAVNASYSDRYHHQASNSNFKQIILARVLTGRSLSYCIIDDKTLRKPPKLPSGTGFYDTVNGYTYGSFVYVVYDHSKSYPAYIITYE